MTGDTDEAIRAQLMGIVRARAQINEAEATIVSAARLRGWTWDQIAEGLGVTRQAVWRKYRDRGFPTR